MRTTIDNYLEAQNKLVSKAQDVVGLVLDLQEDMDCYGAALERIHPESEWQVDLYGDRACIIISYVDPWDSINDEDQQIEIPQWMLEDGKEEETEKYWVDLFTEISKGKRRQQAYQIVEAVCANPYLAHKVLDSVGDKILSPDDRQELVNKIMEENL